MDYETEEQQVDALKQWWRENGRAVIAGVVIGVLAIGGWTLWQDRQEGNAVAASDAWSQTVEAAEAEDAATVERLADTLVDKHGGTLYAAYGQLAAARVAIEDDRLDAAAERLAWVVDEAPQDDVRLIARIRLARVQGAQGDAAAGLERLPEEYPEAFTGLVEEARGDLLLLADDPDAARSAYEAARASGRAADPDALGMKIDALVAPVAAG